MLSPHPEKRGGRVPPPVPHRSTPVLLPGVYARGCVSCSGLTNSRLEKDNSCVSPTLGSLGGPHHLTGIEPTIIIISVLIWRLQADLNTTNTSWHPVCMGLVQWSLSVTNAFAMEVDRIKNKLRRVVEPYGFECYHFKVWSEIICILCARRLM